jgi:hypothetical protein
MPSETIKPGKEGLKLSRNIQNQELLHVCQQINADTSNKLVSRSELPHL